MKKTSWIFSIVAIILLTSISAYAMSTKKKDIISANEIKNYAYKYVDGRLISTTLTDGIYMIDIVSRDQVLYELRLHAKTGELLNKTPKYKEQKEARDGLTLKEAKQIAQKKIHGTIYNVKLNDVGNLYTVNLIRGKYEYELFVSIKNKKVKTIVKHKRKNLPDRMTTKEVHHVARKKIQGAVIESERDIKDHIYKLKMKKGNQLYKVEVDPYEKKVIAIQKCKRQQNKEKSVKKSYAKKIALNNIAGEIVHTQLKNGIYHFDINTSKGMKHIRVDAATGQSWQAKKDDDSKVEQAPIISEVRAQELALAIRQGIIQSAVYDSAALRYDITIQQGEEISVIAVDAKSGHAQIVSTTNKNDEKIPNDKDMIEDIEIPSTEEVQEITPPPKAILSEESVSAIALTRASGTITKFNLSNNLYMVEIRDGTYAYTMTIDAYTGAVTNFNKEYEG